MNDQAESELERRLGARPTPAVSDALRARILSHLARERRRESLAWASTLLGVCAAGWILSLPVLRSASPPPLAQPVEAWMASASLELDHDALRFSQTLLAQARVPRIAPPLRSEPRSSFPSEPR